MQINIPYKIRAFLYIATGMLTPIVTYYLVKGTIGHLEMSLWAAEVTFIMAIAGINTTPNVSEQVNINTKNEAKRAMQEMEKVAQQRTQQATVVQPVQAVVEPLSNVVQPTSTHSDAPTAYDVMPQTTDDANILS